MKKVLLISIIILVSIPSIAQWELYRKSAPNLGRTDRLLMATDTTGILFADNTFYSTTDNGRIWDSVYAIYGISDTLITSRFIDGFTVVIDDNVPIVTTDGGRTWDEKFQVENFNFDRFQLINDTLSFFYGYYNAGVPGYKLLNSFDEMFSWTFYPDSPGTMPPGSGNPNDCFYFFGLDTGFYILKNGITYFTSDRGVNWEERDSIPVTLMQEVFFYDENTGFAYGTGSGEVFKTTDGGWNWQNISIPNEAAVKPIEMKIISPDSAYMMTCNKLFFTSDGGTNWTVLYESPVNYLNTFSILNGNLYISVSGIQLGYHFAAIYSTDNGSSWDAYTFSHNSGINVDFINDSTAFIGGGEGMAFNPYFYKTTDGFKTLNLVHSLDSIVSSAITAISMANDSVGYMGLSDNFNAILKTTDAWETVSEIRFPDSFHVSGDNAEIETYGDSIVFVKYFHDPYLLSRDAGNSWTKLSNYWSMNGTDFFILDENNLYNAGFFDFGYGNVDHSSDGGETWTRWTVSDTIITCVYFHDENTGWAAGWDGTIVYTTDGGETWNESFVSQPHHHIYQITFLNESVGYALTGDIMYHTTDGGLKWGIQNTGDESGFQVMRFTGDNKGYIFGRNGLVMRTLNAGGIPVGTDKEPEVIPSEFVLKQNYPNPFNPVTTIEYSIPEASDVSITVFNVIGEEVAGLVSGYHNPGNYKVRFDAGEFTSGVYFYRIKTHAFTQTKKMLLMK